MTKFKDFGSGPSNTDFETIEFKIYDESFTCMPQVQGAVLLGIVGSSGDDTGVRSATMITEFFQKVLTDESWARFDALINSKDKFVSIETLGEITGWIIQEYTDRPEKQPGE